MLNEMERIRVGEFPFNFENLKDGRFMLHQPFMMFFLKFFKLNGQVDLLQQDNFLNGLSNLYDFSNKQNKKITKLKWLCLGLTCFSIYLLVKIIL